MVQGRAARWTVGNFDNMALVTEMLNKLGWRTLEQRGNGSLQPRVVSAVGRFGPGRFGLSRFCNFWWVVSA